MTSKLLRDDIDTHAGMTPARDPAAIVQVQME
jgi:hypothetical protein